jgi:hypothetical protein
VTATSATSGACTVPEGTTDLEASLAFVPDTDANRELVYVADLQAFLDDQGKELPGDFGEIKFVDPVALFTPTPLLQDALSQADETTDPMADEYGIGLGQVRLGVSAGLAPDVTELLFGDFDPAAVEQAVGADPLWNDQKTTVQSNGQTFYAWGEDDETQIDKRSPMRKLGIGGRLWVGEEVAAVTRSTGVMEAVLAGCAGAAPTLADDDTYAGIAERLATFEGAFDATLTDQVRGPDEPPAGSRGSGSTAPSVANLLEGVTAYGFASGPSDDPERARILLVIATGSDEEAADNVQPILDRIANGTTATTGQLWSEMLEVESTDVDGPFVIVDLRAENASVLRTDLMRRDSLIVSE